MITDNELISKIRGLKQVKPRKVWVILAKSEIFRDSVFEPRVANKPSYRDILANILRVSFQRKYAYALATFLFVMAGVFSFMQYGLQNSNNSDVDLAQKSPAALVTIKNNVEEFKTKSKNLSEVAKYKIENVSLAIKEVKDAVKELTDAIQKDPQLAKDIALEVNNNKTYLDIVGADDLKETSDILYKTIDEQMIKDLENTTLTESQQESLNIINDLYKQGKYSSALESILLLNSAMNEK